MELSDIFHMIYGTYNINLLFDPFLHPSFHLFLSLTLIELLQFLGQVLESCDAGLSGAAMQVMTWFSIMMYDHFQIKLSNPHN